MTETTDQDGTAGDDSWEPVDVTAAAALDDDELLVQLVESCLFMAGDMVTERDLSEKLGIPREAIRPALERLAWNYERFNGAIRVRNTHDDSWLMDLHDVVADHVESFYIDTVPYTRSEVMTLAFIAYSQPVPKHVLAFYRGSGASRHATRWIEAGFVATTALARDDPALASLLDQHANDAEARARERESMQEHQEHHDVSATTKPRRQAKQPTELPCLMTTTKFAGYFTLPADLAELRDALETWKGIYGLLD